uniref:ATP synthase complex subunit 8 n=1 Tax=Trichodectes canis TaxID=209909 RepID=A0A3G1TIG7_9NEOP|nr:ATP synthase F0 subunit 8 [Trichodectes canis]
MPQMHPFNWYLIYMLVIMLILIVLTGVHYSSTMNPSESDSSTLDKGNTVVNLNQSYLFL